MKRALVIGGDFHHLIARQKAEHPVEIGTLLVADNGGVKHLLQVVNVQYASQVSTQQLELISGMALEEGERPTFKDNNLRHYMLLELKTLLFIDGKATLAKRIPDFFSELRDVHEGDLSFLERSGLYVGKLRSGSHVLDIPLHLPLEKVLSHHVLIAATTGRGKSNLTSVLLYELVDAHAGVLVLDPHDEYYGRSGLGLKDHPSKEKVVYYTARDAPPGARTLSISLLQLTPSHFQGVLDLSDPQRDMLALYYREKKEHWIEALALDEPLSIPFNEATLHAAKRKILRILGLSVHEKKIISHGVFSFHAGQSTIRDILHSLNAGHIVIVDTSSFSGSVELLIGSLISHHVLSAHRMYAREGRLGSFPPISIVLEEAPRVLGKEILERGSNIFSTIAREGRKFNVGLYAITQLPSLIPRQILANMNTKIIMGIEMQPERESLIQSAAHDLADYSRAIASLDKGEAIITSNFGAFPLPVKIPLFADVVKDHQNAHGAKKYAPSFSGVHPIQ